MGKYGDSFKGPHVLGEYNIGATDPLKAHLSTFLHPKLELFAPSKRHKPMKWTFDGRGKPLAQHWVVESNTFDFAQLAVHRQPLEVFLENAFAKVTKLLAKGGGHKRCQGGNADVGTSLSGTAKVKE